MEVKTSFAGAGHQPIVSGLITPPITPNTQHYVGVLAALIAPTEIHVEPASTTASHSQHHQAHRSYNSMSADLPPPTTGAAQDIRQPFEDLGAYAARAYLPPIPEHINSVLEEHQTKLLAKNINWGMAKTIKDVRSVRLRELGVLNSQPKGGRRTLAEIEQIDGECLARAAFSWNNEYVPRFLNIWDLFKERPDLFVSLESGYPILNASDASFALPAVGFSTEDIPAASPAAGAPSDDGYDTEDEDAGPVAGPSTVPEATCIPAPLSAFDSLAGLNRSLAVVSRTISTAPSTANLRMNVSNANEVPGCTQADDEEDNESTLSTPISISISHSMPILLNRLTEVFRSAFLSTVAALVHSSEPDKTLGWNWHTLEHARNLFQHRLGALPLAQNRFRSQVRALPAGWAAWVWARSPLKPRVRRFDQQQHVMGGGSGSDGGWTTSTEAQLPKGVWMRGPGSKNDGYEVESRESKYNFAEMAMVTFVVPPTMGLTEQDFVDMCQSQEFSDGARGERDFTPGDSVWATIYDVCKESKIKHFAISTYVSIAFGAFSSSFESAFISPPVSSQQPPNWSPAKGPVMPPFEAHRKMPVNDRFRGARQPNALQRFAYWVRSSMGDCSEGWMIPNAVDGSAGWSGAMMQHVESESYNFDASCTKEWVWRFLKPELASVKALTDVHEFVEMAIFAADLGHARTYTFGPEQRSGGRTTFVGGAQGNSALMEARHAQVAQRLDRVALAEGGEGVPAFARTNEKGVALGRMWVEGDERVVELGAGAFDWIQLDEEPVVGVVSEQRRPENKLVAVDDDQVSVAGIEDVEEAHADLDDGAMDAAIEAPAPPTAAVAAAIDPAAILANLQMQIPNAVLLPSTADGELPLIQNSVTGDLYRVFGNHVVHVGDGKNNGVHFSEDDDDEDSTEPEDVLDNGEDDDDDLNMVDTPATSFFADGPASSPTPKSQSRRCVTIGVATRSRKSAEGRPVRDIVAPAFFTPTFNARTPGKRRRSTKENALGDDDDDEDEDDSPAPEPVAKKLRWSTRRAAVRDESDDDDDDVEMNRVGRRAGASSTAAARATPAPGMRRMSARRSGGGQVPEARVIRSLRSRKV